MFSNFRTVASLFLVSVLACLISFGVFLHYLNTSNTALEEDMTTLHKSFEDGLPVLTSSSSSHQHQQIELLTKDLIVSPTVNTNSTSNIHSHSNGKCITSNNNTDETFRTSTNYKNSTTLPQWMKEYFDWHRKTMRGMNVCNFRRHKFIILRCSNADKKCGGLADRLKTLPFIIAAAAYSNRIFLIRWERPTKLEEFLIPNEINWSMPYWFYEETNSFHSDSAFIPATNKMFEAIKIQKQTIVIETLIQDFYGGSRYYEKLDCELDDNKEFDHEEEKKLNDMHGWSSYELIFRDLFNTLFLPSPPVAKIIKEKMKSSNLIPGEYSASQYRAFYAIENRKHKRNEVEIISRTRNAINCASRLFQGSPVFFASDSHKSVIYARKYAEEFNRHIVVFDNEKEALHLDKKVQWKSGNVSDFYPTFVDLLIMAEAKCMSHGVGGFGRFANMLSVDPRCVISHDSTRQNRISYCKWYNKGDIVDNE